MARGHALGVAERNFARDLGRQIRHIERLNGPCTGFGIQDPPPDIIHPRTQRCDGTDAGYDNTSQFHIHAFKLAGPIAGANRTFTPVARKSAAVFVDKSDRVFDGQDFLCRIVGNFASEFFFKRHHQFDRIETVRPKIIDEAGIIGNLCFVYAEMLDNDLPAQVQSRGQYFESQLRRRFGQHAHVGDIRGRGLFWGLEFVADRDTKTPFEPALGLAGKLKKAAFANGLICYPMPGTRDGKNGDHVLLAPPFIATEAELDGALDCLETAMNEVIPA